MRYTQLVADAEHMRTAIRDQTRRLIASRLDLYQNRTLVAYGLLHLFRFLSLRRNALSDT
jgi:hypothetical protein